MMEPKKSTTPNVKKSASTPRKKDIVRTDPVASTSRTISSSVSEIKYADSLEEIDRLFENVSLGGPKYSDPKISLDHAKKGDRKTVLNRSEDNNKFDQQDEIILTDEVIKLMLNNNTLRKVEPLSTKGMKSCCKKIFDSLIVRSAGDLFRKTLASNEAWNEARKLRISGSRIYGIYTYTRNPSPDWKQKSQSYFWPREFTNKYVQHGIEHEQLAREIYENKLNVKVVKCGFIVHPDHRWVGYSPDGLILGSNNKVLDKLIEIKCVYAGKEQTISDCSPRFLEKDGSIKKKHTYYGQIQLGMLLCNVKTCDFILFASFDKSIHVITVPFDEKFTLEMFKVVRKTYIENMLHNLCEANKKVSKN